MLVIVSWPRYGKQSKHRDILRIIDNKEGFLKAGLHFALTPDVTER